MCDAPRLPLSNNETLFADLSFCFSPCRVSVCVCVCVRRVCVYIVLVVIAFSLFVIYFGTLALSHF